MHCLVEFTDGSMLAQLSPPSMTFPIQHALFYPERAPAATDSGLPLDQLLSLDFRQVDESRTLSLPARLAPANRCGPGGTAPAIFNAANEIAVAAFLGEKIPFLAIPRVIEYALSSLKTVEPSSLDEVLATDLAARATATASLSQLK